ncbi:nicotinate-nucleotide pyrophosphorylase [Clostridium botulinum C str. Eklund]|nr:nicotinate-nucleotide pyrophosphorylase [Clostridium botulinum C str. Eklund]
MNWFVVDKFLMEALKEDNLYGDITTEAIVDKSSICSVELIVKEDGIIAGVNIFERVALNMFEKISGIVTQIGLLKK